MATARTASLAWALSGASFSGAVRAPPDALFYLAGKARTLGCTTLISRKHTHVSKFRVSAAPSLGVGPADIPVAGLDDEDEEEEGEESDSSVQFDWKSNWYAVHVVNHLDPKKPQAFTLLGRNMVLWRDSTNTWRCFADECPHRLVPLSEGRIDPNGNLQCSYHGWQFNGNGDCVKIPQAKTEGPESRSTSSPRACAKSFPTTVLQGLIFVWPDENGWDQASATPPPVPSNLQDENGEFFFNAVLRDLPYGYEMLAENVTDLSHLPFSHHGIGSLNRSNGKPLALKIIKQHGISGFEGFTENDVLTRTKFLKFEFKAPGMSVFDRYIPPLKKNKQNKEYIRTVVSIYLSPSSPGKSRIIVNNIFDSSIFSSWMPRPPAFLLHFPLLNVLDGDSYFLHAQEKTLLQKRVVTRDFWKEDYYMPTNSDTFTISFLKWFSKYAGGKISWHEGTDVSINPQRETKREVLDRLSSHTNQCSICSKALKRFQALQIVSVFLASLLVIVAALSKFSLPIRAGLAVCALLLIQSHFWIQNFIKQFVYVGYDHTQT